MIPSPFYLEKRIEPNRSLSPNGVRRVIIAVALANLITAVFLVSIGAYPIPLFLGLDLVGVMIAFRVLERRRQRLTEVLTIDLDRVEVRTAAGVLVWSTAPIFTRLECETANPDLPKLSLVSSGRRQEIGGQLGGAARHALFAEIEAALALARGAVRGA